MRRNWLSYSLPATNELSLTPEVIDPDILLIMSTNHEVGGTYDFSSPIEDCEQRVNVTFLKLCEIVYKPIFYIALQREVYNLKPQHYVS